MQPPSYCCGRLGHRAGLGRIRCLNLYSGQPAWEGVSEGTVYAVAPGPRASSREFALRELEIW